MTVWQWLSNGWALAHLGVMMVAVIIIRVLDKRDKD